MCHRLPRFRAQDLIDEGQEDVQVRYRSGGDFAPPLPLSILVDGDETFGNLNSFDVLPDQVLLSIMKAGFVDPQLSESDHLAGIVYQADLGKDNDRGILDDHMPQLLDILDEFVSENNMRKIGEFERVFNTCSFEVAGSVGFRG